MNRVQAMICVLVGAACYGVISPLVKMAYQAGHNSQSVTVAQFVVALFAALVLATFKHRDFVHLTAASAIGLLLMGILSSVTSILYYQALKYLSPSIGIIMLFQFTWIVLVIDAFMSRKWPSWVRWFSVCLIVIGTFCSVGLFSAARSVHWNLLGIMYGLGSAITYALFLYFMEHTAASTSSVVTISILSTTSFLLSLAVYPSTFSQLLTTPWERGLWGWAFLIALFAQVLPPLLFSKGIPVIGGALAGILGAAELPVAVIFSSILIHEKITLMQWLGILLILAGIVLPNWFSFDQPDTQNSIS